MTYLIDGTTPLPDNGDTGWGSIINAAINAIDGRFSYLSSSSVPAKQALAAGIVGTTLASNVVTSSLTGVGNLTDLTVVGPTILQGSVSIGDNIVVLNSELTSAPSVNAGIEINRGSSPDVLIRWNETTDTWEFTNDGTVYLQLVGSGGAPVQKTSSFTVGATDNNIICNGTGTITVTLPSPITDAGRVIYIKTIAAQSVVSASSNVVPLAGGPNGTAILGATAGNWARLVSDGTFWMIMAS